MIMTITIIIVMSSTGLDLSPPQKKTKKHTAPLTVPYIDGQILNALANQHQPASATTQVYPQET